MQSKKLPIPFNIQNDSLFELSDDLHPVWFEKKKSEVAKSKSKQQKISSNSKSKPVSLHSSPVSMSESTNHNEKKTDKIINELKASFEEVKKSIEMYP